MILRQTPELKWKEIEKKFSEQNAYNARCNELKRICLKAEKVSIARRRHLESEEKILNDNFQKAKEAQERKDAELKEIQKHAQVMAELKHQELVQIKINQLFQNNSHEFRCREKQLQNARVQDELLSQIKEKEERAKKFYDDKTKHQLFRNNSEKLQCLEKQSRIARVKEELLSQIKEKEIIQKEKRARENYNDMKLIETWNNENMNCKETGNHNKPKNNLKANSEREVLMKIKNELREKERKKNIDEEKQLLQNVQKLNEAEEKKNNEKRQKMLEYRKELKIMIDQNVDKKNKQRIQMLDDIYMIEMDDSTNWCM